MESFGLSLKKIREQKKISLRKLAQMAHISHSFIKDIESGRSNPSLDTSISLAKALGVPLSDLVGETNLQSKEKTTELSPKEHQIIEKVRKLPPEKLKVLNAVLDTWPESEQKSIQKTDLKKVKDNNAEYICQLLDLNVIVPTIKGRPLKKEEKEKFIKYIRNNPNLLPDEDDEDFLSSYAAHDEGKGLLTTNPELINILKASEKINDILQKYLDKKTDKGE